MQSTYNFVVQAPELISSRTALELRVNPAGHVYLHLTAGLNNLSQAIVTRICKAFETNNVRGLLHLGASELATALPPSLAFGRELAHLFMTRLCATPNIAEHWMTAQVEPLRSELQQLMARVPPIVGAEYLDLTTLEALWGELQEAARAEIAEYDGNVEQWLASKHVSWNMVGRVCFHLAENKANEDLPFAFLATYAARLSQQGKVQHLPLGRALKEYAGANQRETLLALLQPIQRAAERTPWLQTLVDSGAIFQPTGWTPSDAHQFLQSVSLFETCGIVVRIPDWWKPRQPTRPQVRIEIGKHVSGLGLGAMMDFNVSIALGDEVLTEADWQQLLAAGDGLIRLKGHWVEVDRNKLNAVLSHWKNVEKSRKNGLTFLEGMRLLSGSFIEDDRNEVFSVGTPEWTGVTAGERLKEVLEGFRHSNNDVLPFPELKTQLRPYQADGVRWLCWLNNLGLGGCLADDMGLGKTVQVLALFLVTKRTTVTGPHLLVVPTSLIANWQTEIARFAPSLRTYVAHSSSVSGKALTALQASDLADVDVVITTYGSLLRLSLLQEMCWSLVVLDEAQAIKNPGTKQTKAVKALKARARFALSGTPIENRLGDLWSLFDFICPGLLGSDQAFKRFAKRMSEDEHAGFAPLRNLVQPYILRRLKSDKRIIADLPDKTEVKAYCCLTSSQARLYQEAVEALAKQIASVDGIARRGVVLSFLMRFKQICNHPSQWLGDNVYADQDSGKFARLRELVEEIAARQEKVLVFTQFQEITLPIAEFLGSVFGQPGLVLHGGTPVKMRKAHVEDFQNERGAPFMVLSLKAGGTGLNLTAASHVIHFDRWWNPAVENQATDRAYRIGQRKNVLVHKFICRGTIEERIDALLESKLGLSEEILTIGAEKQLTELNDDELLKLVSLDLATAIGE